jgi:hypothetical protein
MNKETIKKDKDIREFLAKAFCIDGVVDYIGSAKVIDKNSGRKLTNEDGVTYRLSDSNRGNFYVTISK